MATTMTKLETRIRPAGPGDLAAIEAIAAANEESTLGPRWPGYLYLEQLLHDATLLVAEREGRIVGFGGAATVGGRRPAAHVTDLFVDPAFHGRGVGGPLLRALREVVAVPDWTTCSSDDPRARSLYLRAGMRACWPVVYLRGPAPVERRSTATIATPAAPAEASAIEHSWTGRHFGRAWDDWAARAGGVAFRLEVDRRVVAVGVARDERDGPGRVLEHLAVAPTASPASTLVAALATEIVAGGGPDPIVKLAVPGPASAIPVLLERGFRIVDADTWCASRPDLVDPDRVVIDPSRG